ncbi:MAG TPA: hypothetical protein ENI17_03385 [Pseudomonas xinjiangensis]|uniref:SH3 domain protein n=2 Tax=root TaxID=1 RepID=A0A7V1FSQ5_9GAMM|nr:hypothetical protein [Halopseudomonas xinjiangensis]HEC46653.1 hypothetical protein [Halopseudomonas xinjiangensis]
MPRALFPALLLTCLLIPAVVSAQVPSETEPAADAAEQDLGILQAELSRVEAERQRLADELASSGTQQQLLQLEEQNRNLRARQMDAELVAASQLEEQRQKWFMVGGTTVGGSLLLGFLTGKMGGRRRRKEWLN